MTANGVAGDRDRPLHTRRAVYDVIRAIVIVVMRTVFRLRAVGVEHVPATGGAVLAPTHRSNLDSFALGAPLRGRYLRFMAKAELYRVPVLASILRAGGCFKVERGQSDRAALETAAALLRAGELVTIYPEGTRNRTGAARPRTGAARLALATGVPLVPAVALGTDRVRLLPPRFPALAVAFGPPIETADVAGLDEREAARIVTERWSEAVAALRADLERKG